MLLVITGSGDFTADYIFDRLGSKAFRLNYDIFSEYTFEIAINEWKISNPTGLTIASETATACFWWKPFNFFLDQEEYVVQEVKYSLREIYGWFSLRGMTRGNSGVFHQSLGKMSILSIAARHLKVPDSLIVWGPDAGKHLAFSDPCAKSLTSGLTTTNKALYTTSVNSSLLDLRYPWFLQEKIDAEFDLTVQFVGNKLFGFARSRQNMKGLDWRQEIFTPAMDENIWKSIDLAEPLHSRLVEFASDLGVQWGRVDLVGSLEDPYFLEFNANGQWLFLDHDGTVGLADAVVEYLLGEAP